MAKEVIVSDGKLWNMLLNQSSEEDMIRYVESIRDSPDFDKIVRFKGNSLYRSSIEGFISSSYFELALTLHRYDATLLAQDPHLVWNILITLYNSNCEANNKSLFDRGSILFDTTYKLYSPQQLSDYRNGSVGSSLFIATRFKTSSFVRALLDYQLSTEQRDNGLTPLMNAIIYRNINNVRCIVEAGGDIDAIADNDRVPAGTHRMGYQVVRDIWIDQSVPHFPAPIGLNCKQLASALFDHFKKYNALHLAGDLLQILKYFGIEADIPKFECIVCMNELLSDQIALQCAHAYCQSCLIAIQDEHLNVLCPLCRTTTHMGEGLKQTLVFRLGPSKQHIFQCIGSRTTVGDVVLAIHRLSNQFVHVHYNGQTLDAADRTNIVKYGLKHNAILIVRYRLPNQFTAQEMEQWKTGKHTIRFG